MKIWFGYDCHAFASVGSSDITRQKFLDRARVLFAEDGCGALFVRDSRDRTEPHLYLDGRQLPNGSYGVTDEELNAFFTKFEDAVNWEARG